MKRNVTVFRLAFCAICAGLSTAVLWLGAVTGLFDLSALLFAGTITVVMRIEAGEKFSWVAVAVTFVLAIVFLPEKLLALGYLAVSGSYPLLVRFLPKRGVPLVLSRLAIGSALAGIYFLLIKFLFTGSSSRSSSQAGSSCSSYTTDGSIFSLDSTNSASVRG